MKGSIRPGSLIVKIAWGGKLGWPKKYVRVLARIFVSLECDIDRAGSWRRSRWRAPVPPRRGRPPPRAARRRGEGQPRAARGRSRRPSARGQRAARGTRAKGAGRHVDGLGAAPSSCSPWLLLRRDGELQTSAPGADPRPPAVLVFVSSSPPQPQPALI